MYLLAKHHPKNHSAHQCKTYKHVYYFTWVDWSCPSSCGRLARPCCPTRWSKRWTDPSSSSRSSSSTAASCPPSPGNNPFSKIDSNWLIFIVKSYLFLFSLHSSLSLPWPCYVINEEAEDKAERERELPIDNVTLDEYIRSIETEACERMHQSLWRLRFDGRAVSSHRFLVNQMHDFLLFIYKRYCRLPSGLSIDRMTKLEDKYGNVMQLNGQRL